MGESPNEKDDKGSEDKGDLQSFLKGLKGGGGGKNNFLWSLLILVLLVLAFNVFMMGSSQGTEISYSEFKERVVSGEIKEVQIAPPYLYGLTQKRSAERENLIEGLLSGARTDSLGSMASPPRRYRTAFIWDEQFLPLLDSIGVEYSGQVQKPNYIPEILLSLLPLVLIIFVWRLMMKRMGGGMGGSNIMNFGQNSSKIVAEESLKTRFRDVAGCEESKDELVEVVDFLRNKEKYVAIGGKIPKGVLLVGPPGTGKTLMARAVAGEAGVTFFRMSGADFVEMFVGVGAARVRDLFRQAREKAPCIIFIDELDAIGKSRAASLSTNDEREQTLNQLLVEMDGFDATAGVIMLAASNRPEVLDPALLRPGRFDRQVLVDRPDLLGREAILRIHAANVKLDDSVNLEEIARATPGFVGADLATIINEAALLAVRDGRGAVLPKDLLEAIEKTSIGLEKKSRIINPREREIVAYHEVGHALVGVFTPDADPIQRVSIVPRGMGALGYTSYTPKEDRFLRTQGELVGGIDSLLGGRAAEEVVFGKLSTGAGNDIMRATDIARDMISLYGMSEKFKNMALTKRNQGYLDGAQGVNEYSEETQRYIDGEIARLLKERYEYVMALLRRHRDLLERITDYLLDVEILDGESFMKFIEEDEVGAKEYAERLEKDLKPSRRAEEKGRKRNEDIIARNKAREEAERKAQLEAEKKTKEEKVSLKEVPLSVHRDDQEENGGSP